MCLATINKAVFVYILYVISGMEIAPKGTHSRDISRDCYVTSPLGDQ
jgi:hypothetical protein